MTLNLSFEGSQHTDLAFSFSALIEANCCIFNVESTAFTTDEPIYSLYER